MQSAFFRSVPPCLRHPRHLEGNGVVVYTVATTAAARGDGGTRCTTTTCSVCRMTAALNLLDGTSPPAAVLRALAGVWDAMADGTYGYGGDDNGDVVAGG